MLQYIITVTIHYYSSYMHDKSVIVNGTRKLGLFALKSSYFKDY